MFRRNMIEQYDLETESYFEKIWNQYNHVLYCVKCRYNTIGFFPNRPHDGPPELIGEA